MAATTTLCVASGASFWAASVTAERIVRHESAFATKMPLADEEAPPYIAPSLGDGPAFEALET